MLQWRTIQHTTKLCSKLCTMYQDHKQSGRLDSIFCWWGKSLHQHSLGKTQLDKKAYQISCSLCIYTLREEIVCSMFFLHLLSCFCNSLISLSCSLITLFFEIWCQVLWFFDPILKIKQYLENSWTLLVVSLDILIIHSEAWIFLSQGINSFGWAIFIVLRSPLSADFKSLIYSNKTPFLAWACFHVQCSTCIFLILCLCLKFDSKIGLQPFSVPFLGCKPFVSSIDTWIPIQIPNQFQICNFLSCFFQLLLVFFKEVLWWDIHCIS